MLEIAESVVDQSARGLGGKTAAPIRHAEPVAHLGAIFAQIDPAEAHRRPVERDGEARFAFAFVDGGDELLGILDRVGMRNARRIRGNAEIVGERCDRFNIAAARRAQHEPRGGETGNIVVSPCRRKSLFRESHWMAPSKTERGPACRSPLSRSPFGSAGRLDAGRPLLIYRITGPEPPTSEVPIRIRGPWLWYGTRFCRRSSRTTCGPCRRRHCGPDAIWCRAGAR